jgi:serine protease
MATPHIAGVAALLYAQGIKNPAAIEAAIKRSAVDLGTPGRDDEYGYGLVDARAAVRGLGVAK